MQLKGDSNTMVTPKPLNVLTKPLTKEERARAEYEALKDAEEKAEAHRNVISQTYYNIQAQLHRAQQALDNIRTRKEKIKTYVKDLNNSIVAGRWYLWMRWRLDDESTPLVYVKEVRRPRKYTWVTLVYVRPEFKWQDKKKVATGGFTTTTLEANYPIIKDFLKEETGQGRLGVLVRWGVGAEKLLESAEQAWGGKKAIRLTSNDPEGELKRHNHEVRFTLETQTNDR